MEKCTCGLAHSVGKHGPRVRDGEMSIEAAATAGGKHVPVLVQWWAAELKTHGAAQLKKMCRSVLCRQ